LPEPVNQTFLQRNVLLSPNVHDLTLEARPGQKLQFATGAIIVGCEEPSSLLDHARL